MTACGLERRQVRMRAAQIIHGVWRGPGETSTALMAAGVACQVVAAHAVLGLQVSDHRLDGRMARQSG